MPVDGRPGRELDRASRPRTPSTGSRSRRGPGAAIRLAAAPLDVGPSLRNLLFTEVPTCVLTSATLCVGSPPRFDFIPARIGLTAAETLALGSPFDYATR